MSPNEILSLLVNPGWNLKQILQVVQVLSKHAGLWVTKKKEIMYSQVEKHHLRPNIKAHSVNLQHGLSWLCLSTNCCLCIRIARQPFDCKNDEWCSNFLLIQPLLIVNGPKRSFIQSDQFYIDHLGFGWKLIFFYKLALPL